MARKKRKRARKRSNSVNWKPVAAVAGAVAVAATALTVITFLGGNDNAQVPTVSSSPSASKSLATPTVPSFSLVSPTAQVIPTERPSAFFPYAAGIVNGIYQGTGPDFDDKFLEIEAEHRAYVTELIDIIANKRPSDWRTTASSVSELSWAAIEGTEGPGSNVFMVDESGIYFGVSHSLLDNLAEYFPILDRFQIKEKGVGEPQRVEFAYFDPTTDTAVIYAPTGKPRKPVEGIRINPNQLKVGDELIVFQMRLQRDDPGRLTVSPSLGEISIVDPPGRALRSQYIVHGMLSGPGSSGAPVVDNENGLVGLLSGNFDTDRDGLANGSTVSSIGALRAMVANGTGIAYHRDAFSRFPVD